MITGHLDPNWNSDDFVSLQYKKDTIKTYCELENYVSSGHNRNSIVLYNYFEPAPMPSGVKDVKQYFQTDYKNVGIAVNLFTPGCYVPDHFDLYQKYKEFYEINGPVCRFIVMLDDHVAGQMLSIDGNVITNWCAGDYFGWQDAQSHAFYNMSTVNRYAIQVTGSL